ncbi:MAG: hypothetical protein IKV55_00625 [Oscillospiraceae bacterium]|nr:hypothetical protein [Oscillospiraceae bacterium]
MTGFDYVLVAVYFVLFIAVIRWCINYVKQQQQNPLDRSNNADKLPVGAQKKLRANANQRINSRRKR